MKSIRTLLIIIMLFSGSIHAFGQSNYVLNPGYSFIIHGTSNLHDWDEKSGSVSGNGIVKWNSNGSFDITALEIAVNVQSIKSSESSIMNSKTYKALKSDAHPQITFTLTAPLQSVQVNPAGENVAASGSLNIAGVTHPVTLHVKIMATAGGDIAVSGSHAINTSDYNMEPVTALFGALKVGNVITVEFKTDFKNIKSLKTISNKTEFTDPYNVGARERNSKTYSIIKKNSKNKLLNLLN